MWEKSFEDFLQTAKILLTNFINAILSADIAKLQSFPYIMIMSNELQNSYC